MLTRALPLLLLSLLRAGAAQPHTPPDTDPDPDPGAAAVRQLRAHLGALADTLHWDANGTLATYGPVERAARDACAALAAAQRDAPGAVPQADDFALRLGRLVAESGYLAALAATPGYAPEVLDSPMFLTGSVDEWRFAVARMAADAARPSRYREPEPEPGWGRGRGSGAGLAPVSAASPPGTVFRDVAGAPAMVVLPTGSYTSGATAAEHERWDVPAARRDFELPRRRVTIARPLAMGRTEVTVGQFDAFVRASGWEPRGGARWWDPLDGGRHMVFNAALGYRNPGFPQGADSPVVAVTRRDAEAYARWLSARARARYRLPSEDEWEWAARAGSRDAFFWGPDLAPAPRFANTFDLDAKRVNGFAWACVAAHDGFPHTAPVASFAPNAFGLYDVTGNAREFMADTWLRNLTGAARDGSVHDGPAPFPVVRGGAWNYQPQNLRISYRSAYLSSEVATNMFGFRLVREL